MWMCVKSSKDGDIPGCPFCDTMDHLVEDCPRVRRGDFSFEQLYEVLVVKRANKCQFRTRSPDFVFRELILEKMNLPPEIKIKGRGKALPVGYPHSRRFAIDIGERGTSPYWKHHDYNQEPDNLPVDPATSTLERIKSNRSLSLTWQTPEEMTAYYKKRPPYASTNCYRP